MPDELDTKYDQSQEPDIYKKWEDSGFFNPDNLPAPTNHKLPTTNFSIIMPPPNANGHLHAGHAMFVTIEDIMTRYARMTGRRALWLPGADHAGFETQVVYEKKLEKEGRSRFEMSRDELYKEILAFTLENKKHMESELRALGASCDWSREKFTLDDDVIKAVYATFKQMFDDGLVYRGTRIVSWCPKHQTSFSELEIEDVEREDPLYYLQYGPFEIATSRPETKFGDKYVVVHPDDPRYAKYTDGQKIELEWINGPVTATIIKDAVIDMEFGTGAMTITPWHDATDFDIAERHKLDKEQIIDMRGKLLPIAGEFAGMKISEARAKIVEKLKAKGLLVKIDEKYKHVVRTCYKCAGLIEPQIKEQWFVKTKPLAERAITAIESGEVTFVPEYYKKICLHWLENIIDWNISRQIAWGIRIPAWFCLGCGTPTIDPEIKPNKNVAPCAKCNGDLYEQDPDVFDTWFSSGQWPFITLGYPDSKDFKDYYPTDVMETSGDIIFFWVTRMLMFGLYKTGKVPFKTVYLHGLVLDAKGRKMSKSKGNVINPLDLTSKYGTDALRMALVVGNTPGTSLALAEDRVRGYRNFSTKIWNVLRFVIMNRPKGTPSGKPSTDDEKNLAELRTVKAEVAKHIENFEFHLGAEKAYHYVWHTFADKIVEEAKPRLQGADVADKAAAHTTLMTLLTESLKMLHPFMPFVTEAAWGKLVDAKAIELPDKKRELLMIQEW